MPSKVTSKQGDEGNTRALSGDTYRKSHPVMSCTGALDTLRAYTALLRIQVLQSERADAEELAETLLWIIHTTFLIGSHCSDPRDKHPEYRKIDLGPSHLSTLEAHQAKLEADLDLGRTFIAAASNTLAAHADVTCTLTRAFERKVVALGELEPSFNLKDILPYTNRLSDFFFVLARHFEDGEQIPLDYGILDPDLD